MLDTMYEDDDRPSASDPGRASAHGDATLFMGRRDLDAAYAHLRSKGVDLHRLGGLIPSGGTAPSYTPNAPTATSWSGRPRAEMRKRSGRSEDVGSNPPEPRPSS